MIIGVACVTSACSPLDFMIWFSPRDDLSPLCVCVPGESVHERRERLATGGLARCMPDSDYRRPGPTRRTIRRCARSWSNRADGLDVVTDALRVFGDDLVEPGAAT